MTKITTSWDDGDVLDIKVAALLDAYGIRGTFYVAKEYREHRVNDVEIRELSFRHEIGGHTLTHPDLRKISRDEKTHEIKGGKDWLEGVLGHEITMFCYPSGRHDADSAAVAREVGFKGARTTEMGMIAFEDRFAMPTTLSVYPMPFRMRGPKQIYWRHMIEPLLQRGPVFRKMGIPLSALRSFESVACAAFDVAQTHGGTFHLWGHSWELEQYGMWEEFERVLKYISRRENCEYVTNGELI